MDHTRSPSCTDWCVSPGQVRAGVRGRGRAVARLRAEGSMPDQGGLGLGTCVLCCRGQCRELVKVVGVRTCVCSNQSLYVVGFNLIMTAFTLRVGVRARVRVRTFFRVRVRIRVRSELKCFPIDSSEG